MTCSYYQDTLILPFTSRSFRVTQGSLQNRLIFFLPLGRDQASSPIYNLRQNVVFFTFEGTCQTLEDVYSPLLLFHIEEALYEIGQVYSLLLVFHSSSQKACLDFQTRRRFHIIFFFFKFLP